jgi:hypothetical protein
LGDDSVRTASAVDIVAGVFEGVPWIAAVDFGGAVCAPNAWKPSQRASSRTFAVLAW